MDKAGPDKAGRGATVQVTTSAGRPDVLDGVPDIAEIENVVRRAIDRRQPDLLELVGFGEFSLALRWTSNGTDFVVKRVPPFPDVESAAAYCELTRDYIKVIEASGIRCVETDLLRLDRADGSSVVYHCQPLLDASLLVSNILRETEPRDDHPAVEAVVAAVGDIVNEQVALDAQCANWYWHDRQVWYLDLSTPLLLDDSKMVRFEIAGFAREYPLFFRPVVKGELLRLVPHYTELGHVLHDLVANLHREDLVQWGHPFAQASYRRYGIDISLEKAAKMFRGDKRLFPWLQWLRRAQRFWIQNTGRRYDSMLPAVSSFGK